MLQGFGNARRSSAGSKKDSGRWFDGQQQYSGPTTPSVPQANQAAQAPGKQSTTWFGNQSVYTPESVTPKSRGRAVNTFQRLQAFLESHSGGSKEEGP